MITEWPTLLTLLAATGLFVHLWHAAGQSRPAQPGLGLLARWLHPPTLDGSGTTLHGAEGEVPLRRLPADFAWLEVLLSRLCLAAFYALAAFLILFLGR